MSVKILLPILLSTALVNAAQFKFGNQTFTVPDGFTVERVAGPPLVNRPIEASFDEQGRLYVTDSSGSNARVPEQIKNPTHRIVRLEDTDGDGKIDKSVVFADKMMFPEGVLWHDGALYVSGVPIIWKLEDTNGDGRADKRTKWFDGKTANGCANDLHGPYLGLHDRRDVDNRFFRKLDHDVVQTEHLPDQELCISLFEHAGHAESLTYAREHAGIIRRFGRFPHRNAILGRESSAEEKAFLTQPGSSF